MGEGEESHVVQIPEPFSIARYPITNAQYRYFVEAGGYSKNGYWTDAGWAWKKDRSQPDFWDDVVLSLPNLPVQVVWYEAAAYAAWLRSVTNKPYRLPSEAEWERAARSTDGRAYPWGESFEVGRCNGKELALERPTAVGCFTSGQSADGVEELCGNVWEWCQTKWEAEWPWQDDEREAVQGNDRRVVRGGSYTTESPGCGSRGWYGPDYWNWLIGFRVVVSPLSLP